MFNKIAIVAAPVRSRLHNDSLARTLGDRGVTSLSRRRTNWVATVFLGVVMMIVQPIASAEEIIVLNGGSIQDAVDKAEAGDTIIVKPGIYTGTAGYNAVVTINRDDITIKGSRTAVIDATSFEYGIMVGNDVSIGPEGCPEPTVSNFNIKGFTIKNAKDTGLRLIGVDGFRITHGAYMDNEEYGPFPVCSGGGVIAHNFATGLRTRRSTWAMTTRS